MSNKNRMIYAFLKFMGKEMESPTIDEDTKESLEIASQCIQSVFAINFPEDVSLDCGISLETIFAQGAPKQVTTLPSRDVSEKDREVSEALKEEGNDLMRNEKYAQAIEKYTEAISLDPSNKVFYSNRAAAYSKNDQHSMALDDCQRALAVDPNYGKAYRRMGLAYAGLNKHGEAVDCFQKAIELEPDSESCKSNLKTAMENRDRQQSQAGGASTEGAGFNFQSMLNNPSLMNMAQNILGDPSMQNLMTQIARGVSDANSTSQMGAQGMSGLIMAGQQIAERMQASDPELVERLRNQMNNVNAGNSSAPPNNANPSSNPDSGQ